MSVEEKFPDRKQDLDHRELENYMQEKGVRKLFCDMLAFLVEQRPDDTLEGMLKFLNEHGHQNPDAGNQDS